MEVLEAPMRLALGPQGLPSGAVREVMAGVEPEPARRNGLAGTLLGLGRDDGVDLTILQACKDLGVGIAGIGRDDVDGGVGRDRVQAVEDDLPLVHLAGRDLDVEDHAAYVVHRAVLLVARLHAALAARRCQAGLRISARDPLGPPARFA